MKIWGNDNDKFVIVGDAADDTVLTLFIPEAEKQNFLAILTRALQHWQDIPPEWRKLKDELCNLPQPAVRCIPEE